MGLWFGKALALVPLALLAVQDRSAASEAYDEGGEVTSPSFLRRTAPAAPDDAALFSGAHKPEELPEVQPEAATPAESALQHPSLESSISHLPPTTVGAEGAADEVSSGYEEPSTNHETADETAEEIAEEQEGIEAAEEEGRDYNQLYYPERELPSDDHDTGEVEPDDDDCTEESTSYEAPEEEEEDLETSEDGETENDDETSPEPDAPSQHADEEATESETRQQAETEAPGEPRDAKPEPGLAADAQLPEEAVVAAPKWTDKETETLKEGEAVTAPCAGKSGGESEDGCPQAKPAFLDLSNSIPPCSLHSVPLPPSSKTISVHTISELTGGKWGSLNGGLVEISCSAAADTLTFTLSRGSGTNGVFQRFWGSIKKLFGKNKGQIEVVMPLPRDCDCKAQGTTAAPPVFAVSEKGEGQTDVVMIRCTPQLVVEYPLEGADLCAMPEALRKRQEKEEPEADIKQVGHCLFRVVAPAFSSVVATRSSIAVTSIVGHDEEVTSSQTLEGGPHAGSPLGEDCRMQDPTALKLFLTSAKYLPMATAVVNDTSNSSEARPGRALYLYTGEDAREAPEEASAKDKAAAEEAVQFQQISVQEFQELETRQEQEARWGPPTPAPDDRPWVQ